MNPHGDFTNMLQTGMDQDVPIKMIMKTLESTPKKGCLTKTEDIKNVMVQQISIYIYSIYILDSYVYIYAKKRQRILRAQNRDLANMRPNP